VRTATLVNLVAVCFAAAVAATALGEDCDVCPKDAGADPAAREAENAKAQLEKLITLYSEHLASGDVDGILELYSSEPVFMPEYAPPAVGRAAVRRAYEWVLATLKLNGRFTVHEAEVMGDWAWVRSSALGRFTLIATGAEADIASSELFVFKREDGVWKIHRYIFTTAAPPSAAN
jgi:ketosteroid isomerase-like protein